MEGKTPREMALAGTDNGKHAVKAQAFIRLGLILEYDQDAPPPVMLTHAVVAGTGTDVLWGIAALPSAGDEAGCAAVDGFAARHHVVAGWEDGRYRAVIHLGGCYRYGAFYMPERVVSERLGTQSAAELAATA